MDYVKAADSALSMLTRNGRDVTHRSYTDGTYDETTGLATPVTADTTRKGALFDFGAGQTMERGTLIKGGDKRLLLDAEGTVSLNDRFIVGGIEYTIVSIGEVNPAGTPVLYDIHLQR